MYKPSTETFKNPVHLVRPLTVDRNRRLDRSLNNNAATNKHRPKTGGIEISKQSAADFQSSSTSTNFSFGSDTSYDTDFDEDAIVNNDDECIGTYKRACKIEKTVPVKQYLEHYTENKLSLDYYGLGPKGMRAFKSSLTVSIHNYELIKRRVCLFKMNQYITKLDLASNGLGDEGVIYLAQILRDNVAIVDVNLSQNFIGIAGTQELCDLFKENHIKIHHINLEGNLLNDKCVGLLAETISSTGQLYTLNLSRNRIGPAGGIFLGPALVENTTMQSLDLSWNSINGKGAVELIKGIQKNVFLRILNLAHNGLSGAECGRAWLHALKENTTLIELDLSHNRLTAEPATYIGRGLAKSESLQKLNLTGNPLESAGCYAILKPLVAKNVIPNELKHIDLTEIMVNRDFHELYLQVTTQRPQLTVLVGLKPLSPLLKGAHRPSPPSPMERLHTLFQRRPHLDLTNFFFSVATSNDEIPDGRITDHARLKQAIQENLHAQFSDADIDKIIKEISQFDCKKFILTFDNKPSTASLSSLSWRFKS